ncbi:unnamed protein product, partial [Cylicostephanus goldi]
MFLTGSAKIKYNSIDNAKTLKWDDLVMELAKKCKNEAVLSNIRDELHGLIQGKDSVGEFARKVLAKAKVAYQGQDKRIISQLAIDVFIKGLRADIRKAIRRLPKKDDYEEVVSSAEKEARILDQERAEDRDAMRAINSLIVNDKLEKIQDQLNNLSLERSRNTRSNFGTTNRGNFAARGRGRGQRRPGPSFGPRGSFRGSFPPRGSFPRGNPWNPWMTPRNYYPPPPGYYQPPQYDHPGLTQPVPDSGIYQPSNTNSAAYPPRAIAQPRKPQNILPLPPFCVLCLLLPTITSAYQICGTSQFVQSLLLPKAIPCLSSPGEPMITTNVQLFGIKNDPLQLSGVKCYRDVIK